MIKTKNKRLPSTDAYTFRSALFGYYVPSRSDMPLVARQMVLTPLQLIPF
jgi:hypothetical protein